MSKVAVVIGMGPGNGEAFARKFHAEGFRVALLSRSTDFSSGLAQELGDGALPVACDVTDADAVARAFATVRSELGPVHTLLFNAGSGVFGTFDDVDLDALQLAWDVNVRGLFLAAKAAVADMRAAGQGNILITGATASLRGGARFLAFAQAKGGQRNLAQSLARHLWPENIHVAYVILDGIVKAPRTAAWLEGKGPGDWLEPADIAHTMWTLSQQPATAWTFECEVRPRNESW